MFCSCCAWYVYSFTENICVMRRLFGCELQVKANCIGARISSAPPVDILPRHKPYLHKIQPKDPVELENGGYVSELSVVQYCQYSLDTGAVMV